MRRNGASNCGVIHLSKALLWVLYILEATTYPTRRYGSKPIALDLNLYDSDDLSNSAFSASIVPEGSSWSQNRC